MHFDRHRTIVEKNRRRTVVVTKESDQEITKKDKETSVLNWGSMIR